MAKDTGPTTAVRETVLERDNHVCLRCGSPHALQIHHRMPRGAGGSRMWWINLPSNLVTLCLTCHGEVESHRAHAVADGWLVKRGSDLPSDVPIRTWRGDYLFLTDEGGLVHMGSRP